MSLKIKIDSFEGPLDLLCQLIDKQELDIHEIPISLITDQYMNVLYSMEEMNLDVASEFLVMAATLLEIKSKMLLPQKEDWLDETQWEDPRQELVQRITEYRRYKEAAGYLRALEEQTGERYFKEPEDVLALLGIDESPKSIDLETEVLIEALQRVMDRLDRMDTHREVYFKTMRKDPYTVEEKMRWISKKLQSDGSILFADLFLEHKEKLEVITTFLALLELMRGGKVKAVQEGRLSELKILSVEVGANDEYTLSH